MGMVVGNSASEQAANALIRRPINTQNGQINQIIPTEVLVQILGFLSPSDLKNASEVCRYWEYLIFDFAPHQAVQRFEQFPLFGDIASIPVVDLETMDVDQQAGPSSSALAVARVDFVWERFRQICTSLRIRPLEMDPIFLSPAKIAAIHDKAIQRQKDQDLINFCQYLPDLVKHELPSLETPRLSIQQRATRLRAELMISDEVANLHILDLSGLSLATIPPEIGYFNSLLSLNLSNNQISILPNTIGELRELEEISIANNQIQEIPLSFSNLSGLKRIWFNSNQIKTIPEIFIGMTELEEIDLGFNLELKNVPATLGLSSLQRLTITNTKISSLPDSFINLRSLVFCNLEGNLLETLPEGFGTHLTQLQELYLTQNQIAVLPASMRYMESLTTLELGDNLLDSIPGELGALEALTTLNLSKNRLDTLPYAFRNLVNVENLDLSSNLFTAFPCPLLELRMLSHLNLDDNTIKELPDDFQRMEALFDLSMRNNQLVTLPGSLNRVRFHLEGNLLQLDRLPSHIRESLELQKKYDTGGY